MSHELAWFGVGLREVGFSPIQNTVAVIFFRHGYWIEVKGFWGARGVRICGPAVFTVTGEDCAETGRTRLMDSSPRRGMIELKRGKNIAGKKVNRAGLKST